MCAWLESGSKLLGPDGSSTLQFTPGIDCAVDMPVVRSLPPSTSATGRHDGSHTRQNVFACTPGTGASRW